MCGAVKIPAQADVALLAATALHEEIPKNLSPQRREACIEWQYEDCTQYGEGENRLSPREGPRRSDNVQCPKKCKGGVEPQILKREQNRIGSLRHFLDRTLGCPQDLARHMRYKCRRHTAGPNNSLRCKLNYGCQSLEQYLSKAAVQHDCKLWKYYDSEKQRADWYPFPIQINRMYPDDIHQKTRLYHHLPHFGMHEVRLCRGELWGFTDMCSKDFFALKRTMQRMHKPTKSTRPEITCQDKLSKAPPPFTNVPCDVRL
mmetsp:Transcript_51236/g.95987  ORF Transcript_51236/g.95987 Transcript_51236/m.95987 type:complete len:259 (-) Transcript_51236:3670-4446(-)